ncbi:hypothetical protein GCM10010988_05840 [Cnuibacter physcomitrellae]|uniref:Uncharacterized protein n=1 Tax=Cnuibacter physcomitrellae TaxID=1619308 RepID=A0A1X9LJV5_9MICO|nr:hypothetical protein B5808_09855 [Cnuibacter physcomitrellae]GGI35815.1 hypothetical protein GCM10010988_05840 [Cnuibacter physcomitrellae]
MSCDPGDIACQLSLLVEAKNGWDWNAFISTLLSTLAGSAAAFLGAFLVFRNEQRERYESRVDDALAGVFRSLNDRSVIMRERTLEDRERERTERVIRKKLPPLPALPSDFDLINAITIAEVIARRPRDRKVLYALMVSVANMRALTAQEQKIGLGSLIMTLRRWRLGDETAERAIENMVNPHIIRATLIEKVPDDGGQ